MTTAKPTKGPYTAHLECDAKFTQLGIVRDSSFKEIAFTRNQSFDPAGDNEANANLIAEAFNVLHETGLTPRQLDEQRRELLEALEDVMASIAKKCYG